MSGTQAPHPIALTAAGKQLLETLNTNGVVVRGRATLADDLNAAAEILFTAPFNQNTTATTGKDFPKTGMSFPGSENGSRTALTEAGQKVFDVLVKARAVPPSWIYWPSHAAALNAAAEILMPAEGAGLREALETANVELCALVADPDKPDFGPACPNPADAECLTKALTAIRTALASPQPAVEGPVAAGVKDGPVEKAVWAASRFLEHLERVAYRDGAGLRLAPGHVLFDSLQDHVNEAKAALTSPADSKPSPVAKGAHEATRILTNANRSGDLPGCMMPDGGEPCSAFSGHHQAIRNALTALSGAGGGIEVERVGKDRQGVSVIFARSEYDSEAHRVEEPMNGLVVTLDVDGTILSLDIPDLKADMTAPVEGPADPKPTVPGNDAGMREALEAAELALKKFAGCVHNDNGDITVTNTLKCGHAEFTDAYFAHRACVRALAVRSPASKANSWRAGYQEIFDAIGKAATIRSDGALNISVEDFYRALAPQTGSAGEDPKTPDAGVERNILDTVDLTVHCDFCVTLLGERVKNRYCVNCNPPVPRIAQPASVSENETEVHDAVRIFAIAILHGDDEHRGWLLEAAEKFIAGQPILAPRGKGTLAQPAPAGEDETGVREALAADVLHYIQSSESGLSRVPRQLLCRIEDVLRSGCANQPPKAETPTNAPPYGIIDPDYARVFTIARCLAWSEGYAIMMHGSFTRDLDLIAVPWTEAACEPEHLARRIEDAAGLKLTASGPGRKPHGRLAWTLLFPGFSDPRFVDLSVMPTALSAAPAARPGEGVERVRHVKRGTEYEVLGEAEGQVSAGSHLVWPKGVDPQSEDARLPARLAHDGTVLEVYRCTKTGKLWWRFPDEMRDGRFVPAAAPAADGGRA